MRFTIAVLGFLILLALSFRDRPVRVDFLRDRVLELEVLKAEEVSRYWSGRAAALRSVHHPSHKDLMEAELNMRLSLLDLEIAREVSARNGGAPLQ